MPGRPSNTLAMSTRPGSGWENGERRISLTLRGRSPNGASTARRTHALCAAERAAPQEVALRPASHDLIVELRQHGPPSLHRPRG
jgi:hypothetical protein